MSQFIYLLPLLTILAGAITLFLLSEFTKLDKEKLGNITAIFTIVAIIFQFFTLGDFEPFYLWESKLGTIFVVDKFAIVFSMMFLLGTLVTGAAGARYFEDRAHYNGEFFSLLLFALFGMIALAHSNELITALIALETASLCIYMLAGYKDSKPAKSREAMMKYVILGSITSSFFIFGIALVYGGIDSTFITDIYAFYQGGGESSLVNLGVILITITVLFKLGAVPFHAWVVEVYKGAPLPVTMFMAAVFKLALFTIALRFYLVDAKLLGDSFVASIQVMAVLTLIGGTWLTITQNDLKRLLAGSGIVHSGYLLIAIAAIGKGSELAPSAIVFYLISYFVTAIGIFGVLSYVSSADAKKLSFDGFKGLAKTRPYLSIITTIFVLSLAGIPLTIGFMGKLNIFMTGIETEQFWLVGLAILAAFISMFYYFKIIASMYFYDTQEEPKVGMLGLGTVLLTITAFYTVWGGVGVELLSILPGVDGFMDIAKEAISSLK
jgi:NADH-quinone oxidoreductase subunit N